MKADQIDPAFKTIIEKILPPGEIPSFLNSLEEEPVTAVKLNQRKPRTGFGDQLDKGVPWINSGYILENRPLFTLDPFFHAGHYYVQDPSAMYLEYLLAEILPKLPENPLLADLCAAPGGKSSGILNVLNGKGILLANEIIPKRKAILEENLTKWGHFNVLTSGHSLEKISRMGPAFDLVLLDAPCSGEGMFRKSEAARKAWSPELVEMNAVRQKNLIAAALKIIRPGGYLVYCTCTLNEIENELVVTSPGFRDLCTPVHFEVPPQWNVMISQTHNYQFMRFLQHRVRGEGMTYTCLKVMENSSQPASFGKNLFHLPEKKETSLLQSFFGDRVKDNGLFLKKGDQVFLLPETCVQEGLDLLNRIKCSPISMGTIRKNLLIPSHFSAMACRFLSEEMNYHLDYESSIQYLRKNTFAIKNISAKEGFRLASFQTAALGWMKIHNRSKNWTNHYPPGLRILH